MFVFSPQQVPGIRLLVTAEGQVQLFVVTDVSFPKAQAFWLCSSWPQTSFYFCQDNSLDFCSDLGPVSLVLWLSLSRITSQWRGRHFPEFPEKLYLAGHFFKNLHIWKNQSALSLSLNNEAFLNVLIIWITWLFIQIAFCVSPSKLFLKNHFHNC